MHALRRRLRAKATRGKFGPRSWIGFEKFLPGGEKRPSCGALAAPGRLLLPAGSGSDAACGPGHLGLAVAQSGARSSSRGCSCCPGKSVGPAAVGSCPGLCPARLQSEEEEAFTVLHALPSPKQTPSLHYCPLREPGVPTSFGELLVGSFSIAPQPPTSRPQVGGWRLLLTLPLPRPLPHPHHTPTPRRGHATGRSLGSALPGAAPFTPEPGRAGGRGAAAR